MQLEEFLNILSPKGLRDVIDRYDIQYQGDRRKKSEMISAIVGANSVSVGAVISNCSTNELNELAVDLALGETVSGRADVVNAFCLYFGDIDNVDDDFVERVRRREVPSEILAFLDIDDDEHDGEGRGFDSTGVAVSHNSQMFKVEKSISDNEVGSEFDAYYWFLRFPGQIILWIEYYFPKNGQVMASARRKGNEHVEVIYSLGFWVVIVFIIFVVVKSR